MDITFNDKKLSRLVNDPGKLQQKMGAIRAKKILLRLNQFSDAETLEDTRHLAGRFHELSNDRKGQWACDLDQPYRLIFKPQENPIPINANGQYKWDQIKGVEILEIVNYHKER